MLEQLARDLTEDIAPLLPVGVRFNDDDAVHAFEMVRTELIARIRSDAWKMTGKAIAGLRQQKYPKLFDRQISKSS